MNSIHPCLGVAAYMLPEPGEGGKVPLRTVAPLAGQLVRGQVFVNVTVEDRRMVVLHLLLDAVNPLALEVFAEVGKDVPLADLQRAALDALALDHVQAA